MSTITMRGGSLLEKNYHREENTKLQDTFNKETKDENKKLEALQIIKDEKEATWKKIEDLLDAQSIAEINLDEGNPEYLLCIPEPINYYTDGEKFSPALIRTIRVHNNSASIPKNAFELSSAFAHSSGNMMGKIKEALRETNLESASDDDIKALKCYISGDLDENKNLQKAKLDIFLKS